MRKKIGKKIGPVPITLAVVALAAVLSVGLLFTLNGTVTQAQGLPDHGLEAQNGPQPTATKCRVVLDAAEGLAAEANNIMETVEGSACAVSGETVDVVFENPAISGEGTDDGERTIAVYITGGDEYNVQAMHNNAPIGKKGVNEELFIVDSQGTKAGGDPDPGTATVTVNRDMAASNGDVYLFVYHAGTASDEDGKAFDQDGIPFSLIKGGETYHTKTTDTLMAVGEAAVTAANAARIRALVDVAEGGVALDQVGDANPTVPAHSHAGNAVTGEGDTLEAAKDLIAAIKSDSDYATQKGVTPSGQSDTLGDLVADAERAIADLENIIGVVKGTTGSINSFYGATADIAVKVVFRSTATRGTDSNRDGSITGTEQRSTLNVERHPSKTTGEATVMAVIRDANATLLAGFVDLTIESDDEVVFKDSSLKTHRVELTNGSTGPVIVKGLSKTDPVRVKVTANYNSGELIQEVYLSRLGNATDIVATAYSCELRNSGRANDTDADDAALDGGVCDYEIKSLTADKVSSNDPDELVSIGAEEYFFIAGTAKDALSSTVDSLKSGNLTWKAADADARAALIPDNGNANTQIQVDSDAEPGTYNITVEDSGSDTSATVSITVAGDASMISVACDPVMIPTDTGLTDCTVTVSDTGGNIPSNLDTTATTESLERDQVQVSVRSSSDSKAEIIGAKENLVNLDAQGMANFAIQMPLDAVEGSSITVNVSISISDELLRNHTVVMYGEAAPMPEPMPMLLGAPSITSVMSDAAGMATVMLTPGDNASKHWVWAAPTDGSTGMWHGDSALAGDADMVTFSALTSGMNYWFIAVAGRGEGDASEWSAWSSWTAETPIE